MLLCSSGGAWWRRECPVKRRGVLEVALDLAGDVAHQAADDLAFAQAFSGATLGLLHV